MACPFPGMDPYVERSAIFPDFHDAFITYLRGALQPLPRPKYVALTQDRLVLEIRQPYLTIIEPAAGNRVVTAIEVLSPSNKELGDGRKSYLAKRDEFWDSDVNLVEMDLLREGMRTVRVSQEKLDKLKPWHFMVAVTRRDPLRQELYPFTLQQRLPRVAIPLTPEDKDVVLDLPAVFARCWDEGPYPELLRYDGPPPGKPTPEELAWCEQMLKAGGYRS